jgi:hypothetical protein
LESPEHGASPSALVDAVTGFSRTFVPGNIVAQSGSIGLRLDADLAAQLWSVVVAFAAALSRLHERCGELRLRLGEAIAQIGRGCLRGLLVVDAHLGSHLGPGSKRRIATIADQVPVDDPLRAPRLLVEAEKIPQRIEIAERSAVRSFAM